VKALTEHKMDNLEFDTLAIRAGHNRSNFQENSEAIFTTSSFVFKSAEEAAARFSGEDPGYFYSRVGNPTIECFQDRLAALEGGECCVLFLALAPYCFKKTLKSLIFISPM